MRFQLLWQFREGAAVPLHRVLVTTTLMIGPWLLSGCTAPAADYFPISDGARWEYTVEYAAPMLGVQKASAVTRVDGTVHMNDKTYWKRVHATAGIPGAESSVDFIRLGDDGFYAVLGKHRESPEFLATPLPVAVGTTWELDSPSFPATCEYVSQEAVEFVDRTYDDCLKVLCSGMHNETPTEIVSFYARNVGLIRKVHTAGNITLELRLERYEP